jgi:hypothetical protein
MYKALDVDQQTNPMTDADIERLADDICSTSLESAALPYDESALWSRSPTIPFLPVVLRTSSGVSVRLRSVRPDEIGRYYETFRDAANIDQGFRRDEIPTRRFFVWLYSHYYNIVLEEADRDDGQWVAVFSTSPSQFSRSHKSVLCDGSLIVLPDYRHQRRGLASELIFFWFRLCVDLGFKAVLSDTAIDNLGAVFASAAVGFVAVGTVPNAMSQRQAIDRPADVVVVYRSLEGLQSLTEWLAAQEVDQRKIR